MIALTTASKIITGTVGLIKSVDRRVILSPIIKWPLTRILKLNQLISIKSITIPVNT